MGTSYNVEISDVDMRRAAKAFMDLMNKAGAKKDIKKAYFVSSASLMAVMAGATAATLGEEEARRIMHQSVDNGFSIHLDSGFKSPWA